MMHISEDDVLRAVAGLERASGKAIFDRLCASVGASKWLKIPPHWRISVGQVYARLMDAERAGKLSSIWDEGVKPRRRLYCLTDAGRAAIKQ